MERICRKYDYQSAENVVVYCGVYDEREIYPKAWVSGQVEMEFEGLMVPLSVGYDQYLRQFFGDYMQLPPEEKRVSHHVKAFFDLDHRWDYKEVMSLMKKIKREELFCGGVSTLTILHAFCYYSARLFLHFQCNGVTAAWCCCQTEHIALFHGAFRDGIVLRIVFIVCGFAVGIDGALVFLSLIQEVKFEHRAVAVFVGFASDEPVVRILCLACHGDVVAGLCFEIA